ncbi:MAG: hypothetical protein WD556_10975 [Actinomycetota bacterium]
MDESSLRRLAEQGLESAHATDELAVWSKEFGEAAADTRFTMISESLAMVADAWDQALSSRTVARIDELLGRYIPDILDGDVQLGTSLASSLRSEISEVLAEWEVERHR